MIAAALLAVPMAFLWVIVSNSVSLGSFVVGYLLGFAILFMIRVEHIELQRGKLPDQLKALAVYFVTLVRDIWNSSLGVAKLVLNPDLPINPGIVPVAVQQENASDFVTAFSAHGITITPGELVVDFDGNHTMYVHCIDVEASGQTLDNAQTKRLKLLKRIEGKE